MDANKLRVLREVGYSVRACAYCEHFRPGLSSFGTCAAATYVHQKHSGEPRELSVSAFGSCPRFEPKKSADRATGPEWDEFVKRYPSATEVEERWLAEKTDLRETIAVLRAMVKARDAEVASVTGFSESVVVAALRAKVAKLEAAVAVLRADAVRDELARRGADLAGLSDSLVRRIVRFCHPDRNPDRVEEATSIVAEVNGRRKT